MGASVPATILVVEDSDPVLQLVSAMLLQDGYDTIEAADGVEALRLLDSRKMPVDLVLTDVVMPRMDGPELSRHLAQTRPELRIMFMSGYSEDPLVRRIESMDGLFLPKPFTSARLLERVRTALHRPWTGLPNVVHGSAGAR